MDDVADAYKSLSEIRRRLESWKWSQIKVLRSSYVARARV